MDPISIELINSSLLAYADEMTNNFWRTSYSFMNYEVRDYAVGFVDAEGRIITQSRFTHPAFTAELGFVVKAAVEAIGEENLEKGDIIATNDPHTQGQHLNNVVVFGPMFIDGKVFAYSCIRAHLHDVGGAFIGSGAPNSREIFQEGIQLPAVKIYRAGEPNREMLRLIERNTRFPELVLGDLNAQVAVTKLGLRRLQELVAKYGASQTRQAITEFWDLSEKAARKMVRTIPNGEYAAESALDNDGVDLDRTVPIKVRVVVEDETMEVDFTDMADQVKGSLNSGFVGGALNVARIAFKCLTTPKLISNEGCFRPLRVTCPEGKLLSARHPAAMYEWSVPFPTIIDTILKALAPAIPDRVPAATRGDARGAGALGFNEETRKYFTVHIPHIGGHGARPDHDGPAPKCAIQQGDEHSMPVELNETKFPVFFDKYGLREDSGGAGRYRGGLGVEIVASLGVDGKMRNGMIRSKCLPWGAEGGDEGTPNLAFAVDLEENEHPVGRTAEQPLPTGWKIRLLTGGGGGYGPAVERPPEAVLEDVRSGYVSVGKARDLYGVVINEPELVLDSRATEHLRARMVGNAS